MKTPVTVLFAVVVSAGAAAQGPAPAPQKIALSAYLLRAHEGVQRNLNDAAEKMPEEHYGFKPTDATRPFAQVVAHIALSRFGTCATVSGRANPHAGEKEELPRSKAQVVALIKEAGAFCTEVFSGLTDEALTQFVTVGAVKNEVAKGVFIAGENAHANEVYGTMAVYLRLKGLVPPSTERTQQRRPH